MKTLRKREKIITATCRTSEGIEWSTLRIKPEGNAPLEQGSLPVLIPEEITEETLATLHLPETAAAHFHGDTSVALRTSELLLRVMEFPTADPAEIASMVGFQIDKVSPFPLDQLAVSHEILHRKENTALVLMAAARRENIDAIGDVFEKNGIRIHSIDARVLGWLQLLREKDHLAKSGSEVLIIVDEFDFVLVVLNESQPIAFRSLHVQLDDMTVVDELAYEIGYALTTLDTEHQLPPPAQMQFWCNTTIPMALRSRLAEKCGLQVRYEDLLSLPPLSEGILRRTMSEETRIELIPREWVEHQKRQVLIRQFTIISSGIAAVWLMVLSIFFIVYKARDIHLNRVSAKAASIAPAARIAQENQDKLKALKAYTDRTDSSLECLREATLALPAGDIDYISYNYKKGKGVTLRGTAASDDVVYEFFKQLSASDLFEELKDQSVNTKVTKGVKRTVYSVTLELPQGDDA